SRAGGLTLPKAQIINIDRGGEIIECMFNPKEYSMAKKNNWGAPKSGGGAGSNTGTNLPRQQYSGGQPATLTMQLFFDTYAGTNPTSGGTGGERQWTVKEGDTLASIAYEAYGDAGRWRTIADSNRLTSVRNLKPGTRLGLPARA